MGTLLNGQHDANWKAIIYGVGTAIVAAGLVTLIALEPEITQQLQSLTMLKMGEACLRASGISGVLCQSFRQG